MRKTLIITYYWPPAGGSGVQRWLKLSKYLPEAGWLPIVYTPTNPEYPAIDHSLVDEVSSQTEVLKQPIWEPYQWYKKVTGRKDDETVGAGFVNDGDSDSESIKEQLAVWLRGNLFIPDARVGWVRPSVNYLSKLIREREIEVIISTGPPHSMHLIARKLSAKFDIPWLADFRDPWTQVYYFEDLKLSPPARWIHKRMERKVLNEADVVTVVSDNMKREFKSVTSTPVKVLPNGYDPADFEEVKPITKPGFNIWYAGTLKPSHLVPAFWRQVQELTEEGNDINMHFAGRIDQETRSLVDELGLRDSVHYHGYLPHSELIGYLKGASLLLLIIPRKLQATHILTGKLFDYLGSGRPILALGTKPSDADDLLSGTDQGTLVEWDDEEGIRDALKDHLRQKPEEQDVPEQFSRQRQASTLAKLLNQITDYREE